MKLRIIAASIVLFLWCASAYAADSRSFFESGHESFEDGISDLYRKDKLLQPSTYPELRRYAALRTAEQYRPNIQKEWGEPYDEFPVFLEKNPELLENFWVAVEPEFDDVPAAMRLLKQMWEFSPDRLKEFPELAIAIAVVWDRPDSAVFENAQDQHHAIPGANPATALDNFKYYSSDKLPLGKWIKAFPWEWLCYVVNNKTSAEERRWAIANYSHRIGQLEKAYSDIPWIGEDPPSLQGKEYTLMNMKRYGGVCSCQADFAASVCRIMGEPAVAAAYWARFDYAHAWVIRFDVKKLEKGKIYFTIKEEGNYGKAKQFVTWVRCPQTAREINEAIILHRLDRVGTNLTAYRQTEILMRCFDSLVRTEELTVEQQGELLQKINAIFPGCDPAWKKIVELMKQESFPEATDLEKKRIKNVMRLYERLIREKIRFPNELPAYTEEVLANPSLRKREKAIYGQLVRALTERRRPDLVITVVSHYADSLIRQEKYDDATSLLTTTALRYYDVSESMNKLFDKIKIVAEKDPFQTGNLSTFYLQFLSRVLNSKSDLPIGYRKEALETALETFRREGNPNRIMAAQKQLSDLENNGQK